MHLVSRLRMIIRNRNKYRATSAAALNLTAANWPEVKPLVLPKKDRVFNPREFLALSGATMKIPDELVDISHHITELLRKDDCFNVVAEDGGLEIVLCLQDFGKEYERQTGTKFIPKFTSEILKFSEADPDIAWGLKYAPPDFLFASVASTNTALLVEVAQLLLMWSSEINLDNSEEE